VIETLNSSLERIDLVTQDVRSITSDADTKVNRILENIDRASLEARDLVTSARQEVETTGKKAREKLDLVDELVVRSTSVATKLDEDEGTLGRLVNDSTIADNIEDITDDARGFVQTLLGMQTYVGLRSEYMVSAASANNYVTVELWTRPDKYYLIEFNRGPRGEYPEVELVSDPVNNPGAGDMLQRRVTIRDGTRLTFQIAKRMDWVTLRFGIKESSGGVGVDGQWFDDRLKVSADLFDTSFDDVPRLKIAAAFEFFSHLYVLGGVDDVFNDPLEVSVGELADDIPNIFETVHFGRDYFLGGMVRFNDLDLTALLTIGSGIVLAAAE
jgi:phospholipid/cholesterol/gamma-HCH transport system substrate-binding protein